MWSKISWAAVVYRRLPHCIKQNSCQSVRQCSPLWVNRFVEYLFCHFEVEFRFFRQNDFVMWGKMRKFAFCCGVLCRK